MNAAATHDRELLEVATAALDVARAGEHARLLRLIDAGLPVDLTSTRGDTLLMLAAYHGHADTVKALIGAGADPLRTNDHGQTVMAGAAFKGHIDVLAALVEAGVDPDAPGPDGRTALMFATMFGRTEAVDFLTSHSAKKTAT